MFYPYWATQPTRHKRTVIMTTHGWAVKETGEIIVSNVRIVERMKKFFGASALTISATNIVMTVSGQSYTLSFGQLRDYIKTPASFVTVHPASASVSPTTATLAVNATRQLVPTVLPANSSNKAVTYVSSAPAVATVSATGLVTAKTIGSAVITVSTVDGAKTATSTITVTA